MQVNGKTEYKFKHAPRASDRVPRQAHPDRAAQEGGAPRADLLFAEKSDGHPRSAGGASRGRSRPDEHRCFQLRQRRAHRPDGGTHEQGLRATRWARRCAVTSSAHKLDAARGVSITALRTSARALVGAAFACTSLEPQFQSQTKNRLNNPEVVSAGRGGDPAGARAMAQREPKHRRVHRGSRDHHVGEAPGRPRGRRQRLGVAQDRGGHDGPGAICRASSADCASNDPTLSASCSSWRATPPAARAKHGPRPRARRPSCPCGARCSTAEQASLKPR